jgi:hypothetical protein
MVEYLCMLPFATQVRIPDGSKNNFSLSYPLLNDNIVGHGHHIFSRRWAGGAQRPVLHGNWPLKMGARSTH